MAPRELPLIVSLELAIGSSVWTRLYVTRCTGHPLAAFGQSRLATCLLATGLLLVFGVAVRARRRLLVARGVLGDGPAPVPTYREPEPLARRLCENDAAFAERTRWAARWLSVCLASTVVHRAPLVWSAWLAFVATAGALLFVRFREGAAWALAVPCFAAAAYVVTASPLVGVPQLVLFVVCWAFARFADRHDPSSGWAA